MLIPVNFGKHAAAAAGRTYLWYPPEGSTAKHLLRTLRFIPNATSANNATNHSTLQFYIGSTAVGSARATSSTDLTQGTAESIDISAVAPSSLEISQASPLSIRQTLGGSGVAVDVEVFGMIEVITPAAIS